MPGTPASNGQQPLGGRLAFSGRLPWRYGAALAGVVTRPDTGTAPGATVGRIERRASLPDDASSAAAARVFLRKTLDDWDLSAIEPAASLLATELTTNALLHGGGASSMAVSVRGDRVRIAVADREASRIPRRQHRALTAENGRGMTIVEAYADSWGTTRPRWRRGKVVWCEIALDGSAPAVRSPRSKRHKR